MKYMHYTQIFLSCSCKIFHFRGSALHIQYRRLKMFFSYLTLFLNLVCHFFILISYDQQWVIFLQGSTMGQCEFRDLHMHAVFWHPQKSWCTYFKGDILFLVEIFCNRFYIQINSTNHQKVSFTVTPLFLFQDRLNKKIYKTLTS